LDLNRVPVYAFGDAVLESLPGLRCRQKAGSGPAVLFPGLFPKPEVRSEAIEQQPESRSA